MHELKYVRKRLDKTVSRDRGPLVAYCLCGTILEETYRTDSMLMDYEWEFETDEVVLFLEHLETMAGIIYTRTNQ